MKRLYGRYLILGVASTLLFFSCGKQSFSFVKKIHITGDPSLQLNSGSVTFDIEQYLSAEKISKKLPLKNMKVLDRLNNGTRGLVFYYPLEDIEFKTLGGITNIIPNFTDSLSQEIKTMSFTVPMMEYSKEIPLKLPITPPSGSGINWSSPMMPITNHTFSLGQVPFNELEVDSGTLKLQVIYPQGWSGFHETVALTLQQQDGLQVTSNSMTIDLAGKKLNTKPITISGMASVSATNGVIPAHSSEKPRLRVSVSIQKLKSVTIKKPDSVKLSHAINQALSDKLKNSVQSITFNKVGLLLTLTNNLPEGNPINLTVNSTAFALNETKSFPSPTATSHELVKTNFLFKPGDHSTLDFGTSIRIGNSDPNGEYITLKNITAGQTVSFSGKVSPIIDWQQAELTPTEGKTKTGKIQLPAFVKEITAFVKKKDLHFDPIYLHAYASSDVLKKRSNYSIKAKAFFDTSDGKEAVVGKQVNQNQVDVVDLKFVDPLPATFLQSKMLYSEPLPESFIKTDISEYIAKNLKELNYEVHLDALTITKEEVEKLPDSKLQIALLIDLPLAITGSDTSTLSYTELGELLRKFGLQNLPPLQIPQMSSGSNVKKYLQFAKKAALQFDVHNTAEFGVQLDIEEKNKPQEFSKRLSVKKGKSVVTLDLTKKELEHILTSLNNGPFVLEPKITLPKGRNWLNEHARITIKLALIVDTEVDQTISVR